MSQSARRTSAQASCENLVDQLESLCQMARQRAEMFTPVLEQLSPNRRRSAENLLHYLSLRSLDLRPLQDRLARLGLSSLGRMEPHVLATLKAVIHHLQLERGDHPPATGIHNLRSMFDANADLLERNTVRLLGPHPENRRAHIMVTMSAIAADDYLQVQQMVEKGMDCMRINCVHDEPDTWLRMIEHVHHARRATGRSCRVQMDIAGPKLRTGPMQTLPGLLKIRPRRSDRGEVIRPARIWLSPVGIDRVEQPAADASLLVDADWLAGIGQSSSIRLKDARGARRRWRVTSAREDGCWAECRKTTYLVNGLALRVRDGKDKHESVTHVRDLPPRNSVIRIREGDPLLMSLTNKAGTPAVHDDNGELLSPGKVSLSEAQVFNAARPGHPVLFDDGRISGIVEKREDTQLRIRITRTHRRVESLEGDRGINLPQTPLDLPLLGPRDLQDLEFATLHADLVAFSFTNTPDDVRSIRHHLHRLGRPEIGVVLKIETRQGFANLPEILLESLKFPVSGIMIARGDLAVECGFERLAEIQEEMLWVCEAAHTPVIWATQVLEGLTRRGHATRAEITDAAMSQAAEAVMLNKGRHIEDAIILLDDILQRMQGHHRKKRSMLRKLHVAARHTGRTV